MRTRWIVSWRGLDEECSSAVDALDRWDALEARGIEAAVFKVVADAWTRIA